MLLPQTSGQALWQRAQNLLKALLEMAQWRQVLRVRKQLQRGTLVKLLYLSLIVILQSFIAGGT